MGINLVSRNATAILIGLAAGSALLILTAAVLPIDIPLAVGKTISARPIQTSV